MRKFIVAACVCLFAFGAQAAMNDTQIQSTACFAPEHSASGTCGVQDQTLLIYTEVGGETVSIDFFGKITNSGWDGWYGAPIYRAINCGVDVTLWLDTRVFDLSDMDCSTTEDAALIQCFDAGGTIFPSYRRVKFIVRQDYDAPGVEVLPPLVPGPIGTRKLWGTLDLTVKNDPEFGNSGIRVPAVPGDTAGLNQAMYYALAGLNCTPFSVSSDSFARGTGVSDQDVMELILEDNCPFLTNVDQEDTDGSGVGDACQCGDVTSDGFTNVSDALAIARGQIGSRHARRAFCDVNDDGFCNVSDALVIARGQQGSRPEDQHCPGYFGE